MEKITVKDLIKNLIEEGVLQVIDLERPIIERCSDRREKNIQQFLNIFFHVNFVNNSHDTEIFHFPEDKFEELYEGIINKVPQKTVKENNQHYSTATSYMKMKARKYFVNELFKELNLIDEDIEISFEDYKFNEDYYYYSDYYDSVEWVEYDKFRNPEDKSGLYDLNTKECDNLNPKGMINSKDFDTLRTYLKLFLYKRIIMQVPGAEGAFSIYRNLMDKEFYTKDEVSVISALNRKFNDFTLNYLQDDEKERTKNFNKEMYKWIKKNNDYTLYVKEYKKSSKNSKYLRRSTCQAYIETYHNAIGALYGYGIFEDEKSIEKDIFKRTKAGKIEPIKAIFSRLLEDKMVTYKENLDWNKDEVDEFYMSYTAEAEIQAIDDCISSLDEIANLETL